MEIGPGQGLCLWWAKRRGAQVLGVEASPEFCRSLAADGLPTLQGSFEQITAPEHEAADMLVMFHVLEHFYDPNQALQHCRSWIKDDGLLIVEVPNILKPFRSLDRYFLRYVHPSNFSPATLCALLAKHGFETVLLDEGTGDWRSPQSLFVIARKQATVPQVISYPVSTGADVAARLHDYRRSWRYRWSYAWHSQNLLRRSRRLVAPMVRWVRGARRLRQAHERSETPMRPHRSPGQSPP